MEFIDILTERLNALLVSAVEHLPALGIAVTILVLTWVAAAVMARVLTRVLARTEPRESLRILLKKMANIGIWSAGLLIAVVVAFPSVTPGKLLSALGLGSIAIGFAFKDIFENFIAGMLILLREPFRIGDFVECEGIFGRVLDITVRDTRLRQVNGEAVTLPNAMLFKNPVQIQTHAELRRISIICGVAYHEDVDSCRAVIESAVTSCGSVSDDEPVQVFANEFADSSVNFEVAWWTESDPLSERRSRDEVISSVKSALDEEGIEIPFPYRTLTFNEPLSLHQAENNDQAEAA
ncbi:MAG: mechanosensitive ion channel family protein [Xanthomonadales bacterium]|nr:mechanosensitive ion channel family protein [Gammaproteobacteria bacterium]NNE05305.1 mechanosensitive ion channel family protein [Xanthomonadales bacterium]NNL95207.1 mechanosensitive ion channel family protein [Xanthomonadales bacterium]